MRPLTLHLLWAASAMDAARRPVQETMAVRPPPGLATPVAGMTTAASGPGQDTNADDDDVALVGDSGDNGAGARNARRPPSPPVISAEMKEQLDMFGDHVGDIVAPDAIRFLIRTYGNDVGSPLKNMMYIGWATHESTARAGWGIEINAYYHNALRDWASGSAPTYGPVAASDNPDVDNPHTLTFSEVSVGKKRRLVYKSDNRAATTDRRGYCYVFINPAPKGALQRRSAGPTKQYPVKPTKLEPHPAAQFMPRLASPPRGGGGGTTTKAADHGHAVATQEFASASALHAAFMADAAYKNGVMAGAAWQNIQMPLVPPPGFSLWEEPSEFHFNTSVQIRELAQRHQAAADRLFELAETLEDLERHMG